MKCRIVQTQLIGYIRREVDEQTQLAIAAHLETCTECQDVHQATQTLSTVVIEEQSKSPPELYWTSLLPRIRTRIESPSRQTLIGAMERYVLPLAAAVVLIVFIAKVSSVEHPINPEDVRITLQQCSETELQEFVHQQSIVGIHESHETARESVLSIEDKTFVSNLIASEENPSTHVDCDPDMMYETISNHTADEIASIMTSKNM